MGNNGLDCNLKMLLGGLKGGSLSNIPTNLRQLRMQKGVTQREVCDFVHVDVTMISAYESGRRRPSIEVLVLLAEYYAVTVDSILK
jgi:transcriptional regulator with XRE-family HTH domain